MPYFKNDSIDFYYEDQGEGIPFLALHGLGANHAQQVALFQEYEGIRLITFDFRGHGQTICQCTEASSKMTVFASDALALLDHLGIDQAFVGGISLGAATSLKLALAAPDRVKGLALIRPAWLNKSNPKNLDIIVRIGHWIKEHGLEKGEDMLFEDKEFQAIKMLYPNAAASIAGQFSRPQAAENYILLEALSADRPFEMFEELTSIQCPSLVIVNKHDPIHPLDFGIKLDQALPNSKLVEVSPRYINRAKHNTEVREELAFLFE